MKGAVLIIGSLLWEDEINSLNKEQGLLRVEWRKKLDFENKIRVQVPIRYGRKSSSKRCTYTMVFSNSVESMGIAFVVPFKRDANCFEDIKIQALELSVAEGISTEKYPNRLIASWGAVGILFNNEKGNIYDKHKEDWHKEFNNHYFDNKDYKLGKEEPSIQQNGELNFYVEFPGEIDYVFATPVKPNVNEYPTIEKITDSIIESKPIYKTYVVENFNNGIRVKDDDEIIKRLK